MLKVQENIWTKLGYKTWHEVYEKDWIINLEKSILDLQESLCNRDEKKYKNFLKSLEMTGIILRLMKVPNYKKRLELLRYSYYTLRLLDDIGDWDTSENFSPEERMEIFNWEKWIWLFDLLKEKVLKIAVELGESEGVEKHMNEIILSIKFDVERIIDPNKKRTETELKDNFYTMDTEWTANLMAIVSWVNHQKLPEGIGFLSEATRISYNIRDLQEDLKNFLINISIEDLKKYSISDDDLEKAKSWNFSEGIKEWIKSEIKKMINLLNEYNENFSFINLIKDRGLKLSYNTGYFRRVFNNMIIRYVVSQTYKIPIKKVISNNKDL